MMRTFEVSLLLALPILALGCNENPAALVDDGEPHDAELVAELTVDPAHAHILSPVTLTVVVRDHHDEAVTDFDTLRVERRAVDTDTWRAAADLELVDASWMGTYTFVSSGSYDFRVLGQRPGGSPEFIPFAHHMDPVEAAAAHAEAGAYRVEFESFPGHIHMGGDITMRFWVMEPERDAAGVRPPITGLSLEVHCDDPSGVPESHVAVETEPGVYEVVHTYVAAGEAHVTAHVPQPGGGDVEVAFDLNVVPTH